MYVRFAKFKKCKKSIQILQNTIQNNDIGKYVDEIDHLKNEKQSETSERRCLMEQLEVHLKH